MQFVLCSLALPPPSCCMPFSNVAVSSPFFSSVPHHAVIARPGSEIRRSASRQQPACLAYSSDSILLAERGLMHITLLRVCLSEFIRQSQLRSKSHVSRTDASARTTDPDCYHVACGRR